MNTMFRASLIYVALAFATVPTIKAEGPTQATVQEIKTIPSGVVEQKATEQLFRAGEFQVDLSYRGRFKTLDHLDHGGGIALNYFPWRSAGFGLEGNTEDTKHAFFDRLGFALIGRYPIDKIRIAPEIRVGFQYDMERATERGENKANRRGDGFDVFAGIGGELRFTRNLGVGAELRGVREIEGNEYMVAFLKARITF